MKKVKVYVSTGDIFSMSLETDIPDSLDNGSQREIDTFLADSLGEAFAALIRNNRIQMRIEEL